MAKKRRKDRPKKLTVDVVEAQAISLVDEYGTERASRSCSGGEAGVGGDTVIHLNDDQGRPRLSIQLDGEGNPSICLFTGNNSPGISLALNNGHGNGLMIADSEGRPCISLGVPGPESKEPRGLGPNVTVIDPETGEVWTAPEVDAQQ